MIASLYLLGLSPVWSWLFILGMVLLLAFEIWMLVSAITNKGISDTARVWWVIGMIALHPFIAIAYYITDYGRA